MRLYTLPRRAVRRYVRVKPGASGADTSVPKRRRRRGQDDRVDEWRCACGRLYRENPPTDGCIDPTCRSLDIRLVKAASVGPKDMCVTFGDAVGKDPPRWSTRDPALDRVLGGGIVRDSVILLGGEPGCGKSTLLGELASRLTTSCGGNVGYFSGEETKDQILARAARIGQAGNTAVKVYCFDPLNVEEVEEQILLHKAKVVVIDSAQKLVKYETDPTTGKRKVMGGGSRSERMLHAVGHLTTFCKANAIAAIVISQINGEGDLAGTVEAQHLVDALGMFSRDPITGDRYLEFPNKNRHGQTGKVLRMEMRADGLHAMPRTSVEYIRDHKGGVPGSLVFPSVVRQEVLLCEVAARVLPASAPVSEEGRTMMSFAKASRRIVGMDEGMVRTVVQLLEAEDACATLPLHDIFIEASGEPGTKVGERAADLAVAAAIVSSLKSIVLPPRCVVFGSVNVQGHTTRTPRSADRMAEALTAGYTSCVCPMVDANSRDVPTGMTAWGVESLAELDVKMREAKG